MRWNKIKIKDIQPKIGDVRIERFFAFLPIEINEEIRWLEFVSVAQIKSYKYYNYELGHHHPYWKNIKFVNK